MITEKDIVVLKQVFPTKEEFADLCSEVGDLKVEVTELRETMNERFDSLEVKIDRFLGRVVDVELDNQAGAQILYRHSLQIRALAEGTGIILPEQ